MISLILVLYPALGYALDPERGLEQYNFNEWGVDEKLPQITVTSLVQDNNGYIWVGTQSGIARFNGKEFVGFNRSTTDALSSNIINDLLIDHNDNLWILTDSGLTLLNDRGFSLIDNSKKQISKPNRLLEFNDRIFISAANGLFELLNQQFVPYLLVAESYALESHSNSLLVGGRGQLTVISNGESSIIKLPEGFEKAVVNDIQVVGQQYWLATTKGLLVYEDDHFKEIAKNIPLINEPTNALFFDENNILWVAAASATYRIKDGQLHNLNEKPSYPRVSEFMLDTDGTLWLGTSDRGLFQLWNSWSVRYNDYQGIKQNLIWSVAGDSRTNLIVGSDSGVYKFDNGRFIDLINKSQLPNPSAYTLFIDKDQSIWVGTKGGIAHFDQYGFVIREEGLDDIIGLQVNAIFRDSRQALWILTGQGVFLRTTNKLEHIGEASSFATDSFRAVIEFENTIYLGAQIGLLSYDNQSGISLVKEKKLQTFITSFEIYNGSLIVGTFSEGLFIKKDQNWLNLNKSNGLIFNDSFSLNILHQSLWVSGFDGVYRLSLESLNQFIDGSQKQVVAEPILNDSGYVSGSQKAYCCNGAGHGKSALVDGDIWYPTRKGVLKLEPEKVIKNEILVKTVIETMSTSQYDFDMYFYNESMRGHGNIAFDERDISFRYIGLTSFDEGLVSYRHKLNGYSEQWTDNGISRTATYTNLPHGNYVFEVLASNNNGLWSEQSTKLAFTINPRYYETIYFRLLVILVTGLCLIGMYRLIIYRNKMKVKMLEMMVSDKTKELLVTNDKLELANERLSVYSYTDPLTGAHNRRYLVKQIMSDISHYVRNTRNDSAEQNIVFMLADIDFFKDVNDRYGHSSGDEVLKQVVDSLQSNIRDGDYLIRWGGEEFLIALRPDHVSGVEELCSRLLAKIDQQGFMGANNESIKLSLSIGYCFYPMVKQVVNNWSWEQAVDMADKALYQAKANGRNQWVGYQLMPSIVDDFPIKPVDIDSQLFQKFSGVCPNISSNPT